MRIKNNKFKYTEGVLSKCFLTNKYCLKRASNYLNSQHFQKARESKRKIQHKFLHDEVFLHLSQVMNSSVKLNNDGSLSSEEKQWLNDNMKNYKSYKLIFRCADPAPLPHHFFQTVNKKITPQKTFI